MRKFDTENPKKGFTLIELLVVIAILTVLAVAVVLVLNPAQLIRQGRDSTRISDLSALNSAIALYLADFANPAIGTTSFCTSGIASKSCNGGCGSAPACTERASSTVDGGGWVTINFNSISSGSPLSKLPLDPIATQGSPNCGAGAEACFYQYIPSDNTLLTFELNASMESTKFAFGGTSNVESTDGGDNPNAYEVGNDPGLDL